MSSKKVCMIDIDDTLVYVFGPWKNWYKNKFGVDLNPTSINSNLDTFREAFDFWKNPNLYDYMNIVDHSKEAIKLLSQKYEIVFCSWCFKEHKDSKVGFIESNFKDILTDIHIIDTRSKFLLRPDIAIDDRSLFLYEIQQFNPSTRVIHTDLCGNEIHDTNFKESNIPESFKPEKMNWYEILQLTQKGEI